MIAIVDYGMGNVTSARMALEHVGAQAELTDDPACFYY
jgi:glutamine amidotransferase